MTGQNGTDPAKKALESALAGDLDAVWVAVPALAALPAAELGRVKTKLSERFPRKLSMRDLNTAIREARQHEHIEHPGIAGDGRANIFADELQFASAIEATVNALARWNEPARIFAHDAALVEVLEGRIYPITPGRLREILALAVNFARRTGAQVVDVSPPDKIVSSVAERRRWPLPTLRAVTRVPVLRPDGSLVASAGYDPVTQLYHDPLPGVKIPAVPERPERSEVDAARKLLVYMLQDFPFVDQASRANHVGLMLTAVCRPAILGPAPMAVIDAAKAGTGKSKLSAVPQIVVFSGGGFMGWPRSERELRSSITATLRANPAGINVIDNMPPGRFSSPTLARLLTATTWEDRLLGENTMLRLPNLSTWIVNGNNIQPAGDLPRRCYLIKLEAPTAYPWERTGFAIQQFDRWIEENAGRLFAALLTLARSWYVAGCPAGRAGAVNSYTDWLRVVGGILTHAGIDGFLGNSEELTQDAEEDEGWTIFLAELAKIMPETFTTGDVVDKLYEKEADSQLTPDAEALRAILPEDLLSDRAFLDRWKLTTHLGRELRNREGTRYGRNNVHLQRLKGPARSKARLWKITVDTDAPQF